MLRGRIEIPAPISVLKSGARSYTSTARPFARERAHASVRPPIPPPLCDNQSESGAYIFNCLPDGNPQLESSFSRHDLSVVLSTHTTIARLYRACSEILNTEYENTLREVRDLSSSSLSSLY